MKPSLLTLLICLCALAAAAAVRANQMTPRTAHAQYSWQAPMKAARIKNPLPHTEKLVAGGAKVFSASCAQCHGEKGTGLTNAPDLTSVNTEVQSDGALFWKITHGNPDHGMPSFSYLSRNKRWE